mgnify:CR=1 FL=1
MQSKCSSQFTLPRILVNTIAFILTYLAFLPFNTWLKSTLNKRFYYSYIILFLACMVILFQIFWSRNFRNLGLLKALLLGTCSGYINSIIAYEGMCLIVLNKSFIPLNAEDVFQLLIFIPFVLFGWLYGLVMSMVLFFLSKYIKKSQD